MAVKWHRLVRPESLHRASHTGRSESATRVGGSMRAPRTVTAILVALTLAFPRALLAQETDEKESQDVSKKQQSVHRQYEELEKKIKQVSAAIRQTDPDKSSKLQRAYLASQDEELVKRLDEIKRALDKKDLQAANVGQKEAVEALEHVLEILESDDQKKDPSRLDPKRLEDIQKDLNKLIEKAKGLNAEADKAKDLEAPVRRPE